MQRSFESSTTLRSIDEANSFHSPDPNDVFPDDSISNYRPDLAELQQRDRLVEHSIISDITEEKSMDLSPPPSSSQGIELDYTAEMPSLTTVRKTHNGVLYLFDSSEPHPRIRLLANEPNVIFIGTRRFNGKPYKDKHIVHNIKAIQADISNLQKQLESTKYLRLLLCHHGFGIGSGLCIYAPKTWKAFKHAMNCFFMTNSVKFTLPSSKQQQTNGNNTLQDHGLIDLKWKEWEAEARLYHEALAPEFRQIEDMLHYDIEKKMDLWQLKAKLAYSKQRHAIKKAIRKNDQRLRDQKRKLRRERMKEEALNQKHVEMKRHNELLKIQKEIERQHAEKQKDLNLQMDVLQDRIARHSMQIQTKLAIKGVTESTKVILTDFTKDSAKDDVDGGLDDVFDIGALSGIEEEEESKDDNASDFWRKMKKVDADMQKMRETMAVLKDL